MMVGRLFRIEKVVALRPARAVWADLCNAGFVVNEDKSVWEPTQVFDWLGITWNSALGTLKIVERRIVKIINTIDHILEADLEVSARELASFTGQIISSGSVVGNIGRIMTRHCVLSTLCRDNWDSMSRLDDYCKEELYFWKENMVNINTRYCFVNKGSSYFVYSDASASEGGAILLLISTMILCAVKCGQRTREVKVQRGGSCLLSSFLCNQLSQCWEDHT